MPHLVELTNHMVDTDADIREGDRVAIRGHLSGTACRMLRRGDITLTLRDGEDPDALIVWVDFDHNYDGAYYYVDDLYKLV